MRRSMIGIGFLAMTSISSYLAFRAGQNNPHSRAIRRNLDQLQETYDGNAIYMVRIQSLANRFYKQAETLERYNELGMHSEISPTETTKYLEEQLLQDPMVRQSDNPQETFARILAAARRGIVVEPECTPSLQLANSYQTTLVAKLRQSARELEVLRMLHYYNRRLPATYGSRYGDRMDTVHLPTQPEASRLWFSSDLEDRKYLTFIRQEFDAREHLYQALLFDEFTDSNNDGIVSEQEHEQAISEALKILAESNRNRRGTFLNAIKEAHDQSD